MSSRGAPSSAWPPSSSASPRPASGRVIIPGTHDCYDRASIYRAYDLVALAGRRPDDGSITILDPDHPSVHLMILDLEVVAQVFATKRAPHSPLLGIGGPPAERVDPAKPRTGWRIGMIHGSISIPGKTEHDEVVITTDEIAKSGFDYLALGHWHSAQTAKAGGVTYAYPGAPEPVALDQDRAGKALLVELDDSAGTRSVTVREMQVGKTRFDKAEIDAATVASQPALVEQLAARKDPDLVLDVRLAGVRRDDLDLDPVEIENALAPLFLKIRVRDVSVPALTEGPLPSPDTIAGAFIRDLEARIAEPRERPAQRSKPPSSATPCASGVCSSPGTRSPCEDPQAVGARFPALSRVRHRLRTGRDRDPRTERSRQDHRPASPRARADPPGDEHGRGGGGTPTMGCAA